jgi:hypothetical protein
VLATVCGGDYVAKCLPMLRSLLYYRSTPLTLHIIADKPARRRLSKAFAGTHFQHFYPQRPLGV